MSVLCFLADRCIQIVVVVCLALARLSLLLNLFALVHLSAMLDDRTPFVNLAVLIDWVVTHLLTG